MKVCPLCPGSSKGQRIPPDPVQLEVQAVESQLMLLFLRIDFRPFGEAICSCRCWPISPVFLLRLLMAYLEIFIPFSCSMLSQSTKTTFGCVKVIGFTPS